jgi:hypothetical protein
VVPDLPSLRALRIAPENESELGAAVEAVLSRPELAPRGRVGVIGVSYAGGLALLAALDPALAPRISFVAAVSAHADLDSALRFLATGRTTWRGRPRLLKTDPYGQYVFLKTFEEFVGDSDRRVLEAMAARRMERLDAPLDDLAARLTDPGRLIYDLFETASDEQVPGLVERLPGGLRQRMARLSPARRDLSRLRAHLYLTHARDDGTFPVGDMERFSKQAARHTRTRFVVLESLQHVESAPWRKDPWGFLTRDVPEAWRLAWWWCDLLGER